MFFIIHVAKQRKVWQHLGSSLISFGGEAGEISSANRYLMGLLVVVVSVAVNIEAAPAPGVGLWIGNLLPDHDAM